MPRLLFKPLFFTSTSPLMAELAALSVVANIFQVIGFVKDLYDVAKDIQDTGTSDQLAVVSSIFPCRPNQTF
jgi:hypothetical protein